MGLAPQDYGDDELIPLIMNFLYRDYQYLWGGFKIPDYLRNG
jgi:hypothetical protein